MTPEDYLNTEFTLDSTPFAEPLPTEESALYQEAPPVETEAAIEPIEVTPAAKSDVPAQETPALDEELVAAPKKRGFKDLEPGTQRLVWLVFGSACLLALLIPAAYVYFTNVGLPTPSENVVIVPVKKDDPASEEETKTVKPANSKPSQTSTDESLGEEYEDWDYRQFGRNVLAPAKGKRVMGVDGLNPEYESTYIDALDLEDHATEASGALPKVSGRTPASPIPDDGTTPGVTFTSIKLTGIGTSNGSPLAVFSVDGTTYEAGVGDEIDATGWSVTSISSTTVVISDGTASRTLVLPNGSK